jgi:hypothetical protein
LLSAAGSGAQTMENMLPGGTLSKKSSSDLKFVKIAAPATPPSFTSFMATPAGPTGTLPATVPATQAAGLAASQGAQSQISEAEKTLRPLETQHLKLSEQITQIHNRINSLLEYSYNSSISAQQFFTNMQVENADPQQILVEVGNYKNTIEFDLKVLNQLNTIYESIQNVASPDNKTIEVNTRAKLVQNQEAIAKRQQELITANVYEVSLPIEIQIIQVKAERESALMEKENARQSGGINMLPVYDNLINTYKTEMGLRSSVLSVYQSAPVTEPNTAKVFKGLADRTKRLIRALDLEIKKFRREMSPGVYKNPFRQSEDNTKFVKLAKYEKIADEVIEDYYNDLYDNDPPYGTVLEHPSKFRKTPTYKIRLKK